MRDELKPFPLEGSNPTGPAPFGPAYGPLYHDPRKVRLMGFVFPIEVDDVIMFSEPISTLNSVTVHLWERAHMNVESLVTLVNDLRCQAFLVLNGQIPKLLENHERTYHKKGRNR